MKSSGLICVTGMNRTVAGCALMFLFLISTGIVSSQSRVHYAGKDIFISGINIAWVNFAGDIGPNPPDMNQFRTEFQTVHANGGNVMRFWLHTNGSQTPVFNGSGFVTGPGPVAIQNLKQILAAAKQNDIGLILCLWSHDMLNQSELDTVELHRNARLLNDTAYTNAYIRNALIPMVDSLKGNPAIAAWEIFNEPEGISNEFGWGGDDHVPMKSIQRCINLMAGAIHRADPSALVTSGAVTFQTLTDFNPGPVAGRLPKTAANSSASNLQTAADNFNIRHRSNSTAEEYREYIEKLAAAGDTNYYRDDRLKAVGGDNLGTLDFYCVHYYNGDGDNFNPFLYPCSHWGLNKPVVAAEFHVNEENGIPHSSLYPTLYQNGYAGAMAWSWTDFPVAGPMSEIQTWATLSYMFANYRNDVIIFPTTGSIYVFNATPGTIEKTDTTILRWDTEPGSVVTLDGNSVSVKDTLLVHPLVTTTYTMIARGVVQDTNKIVVTVLPTGRIVIFRAIPVQIGTGEPVILVWHVVKGSTVTLNGAFVPAADSISMVPDPANSSYTLIAKGDEQDSITIDLQILSPDQVDRAYQAYVTASSNDTVAYAFSDPQHITDGNNFSRWQAAASPAVQTVQLDLGRLDSINQVVIRWGNKAYAKMYSLQASPDLVNWSELVYQSSGNGGPGYVETLTGFNEVARYLQLILKSQSSNGAYSIAEILASGSVATGVAVQNSTIPAVYALSQNYPNPFNPSTQINFAVPKAGHVELTVYNAIGQRVAELINRPLDAGNYLAKFDASKLSSGIYFYAIRAGSFFQAKKMILLK